MKITHSICLLMAMMVSQLTFADKASPKSQNLLVLGDSISAAYGMKPEEGWVALLEEKLQQYDVGTVNASISGETTAGGLARMPALIEKYSPRWVIVELGGNDGLRGYPIGRMKANLANIIEQSQAAKAQVLLIGMQIPPNYGKRYTRLFSEAFPELAKKYEVSLVPTFLESVAVKPDAMQSDGIHPNSSAQGALLETAWPSILAMIQAQ
ncbi:arylesterase [uncultured Pseudoteredinibacter sp.]|uniref:arylesterase n=1 Tax=uncultured Pseudoteredinibacter sp. TaxID=1641701 RepID=UPI0026381BA2|nr:arylesterase [uncultured Pseudoteredinibacter sp.]